jgi:putative spermidine/putrescine transport system ATP-binding protein
LKELRKVYPDGTVALDSVSLTCPTGQCTALVGPSGSGKTTILKIIAGLLEPTGGGVWFGEREVLSLPPEKRNIGMVFQSYALFPNMTVQENVEFGLLVRKVAPDERRKRALQALDSVQIAQLAHRKIRQLSGGQQQRVALARAVVFQPDILLLDEPLSALDAKIRQELRGELAQLLRQFRITAVYVTHDQEEAMALGDQVVVMDRGSIMQSGTPFEIYNAPANDFVARFIGIANLYDANVAAGANGDLDVKLDFASFPISAESFRRRWPHLAAGPVQVLCRPQHVTIVDPAQSHALVKVRECLFLGDRIRVTGETETRKVLRFEAHNDSPVKIGDVVPVRVDVNRVHFMAAH